MDPVTGAVVIAGLKYVGSPSAHLVTNFLEKVFSPTGDALGTALAHPIVEWQRRRVERGSHTIAEAARSIAEAGQEPQQVPGRVLMPLLERASLEDDAELSKRWIALLTSAATNADAVLPSFVTILGELSPLEARLLRRIHSACREYALLQNDVIGDAAAHRRSLEVLELLRDTSLIAYVGLPSAATFEILVSNLERMALVSRRPQAGSTWEADGVDWPVITTTFGDAFIRACTMPAEQSLALKG